jgi:histidyl-tRNA synthetase
VPEFKTVRGMRDFLPEEAYAMRYVEAKAREIARLYGFKEIVTPIVESHELLTVKSGEEIRQRMFVFKDLGGRDVTLRPEFTASVARFVATTFRNEPRPFRLFSAGSVYRYDEPQKGRYREFYQSNYELMGSPQPEADVEVLLLTNRLMKSAGLKNWEFKLGHVGVLRGIFEQERLDDKTQNVAMQLMDKKEHDAALEMLRQAGLREKCIDVLRRLVKLKGSDATEICGKVKELVCEYPKSVESSRNLVEIARLVEASKSDLKITIDAGFARGLEYYTGMIFEVYVPALNIALGGGGRYDKLIELFGGVPTPAVGVAHGIDRIILAMQGQNTTPEVCNQKTVTIIPVQETLKGETLRIAETLRANCIAVEIEVTGRKVGKALEDAGRKKLDYAVIVGEREFKEGGVVLRNLVSREQSIVKTDNLVEVVRGNTQR